MSDAVGNPANRNSNQGGRLTRLHQKALLMRGMLNLEKSKGLDTKAQQMQTTSAERSRAVASTATAVVTLARSVPSQGLLSLHALEALNPKP